VSFDSEVRIGRAAWSGELRNRDTSGAAAHGVRLDFWSYFKIGAPLTVVTIALGAWWL
jgi:hypothetical protein